MSRITPVLVSLLVLVPFPRLVSAQGVTTAAVEGRVLQEDASPIPSATLRVTNTATGERWEIATNASGLYVLDAVGVGGPYRVEAEAPGFEGQERAGILLALGQRATIDFALRPVPIELPPLHVVTSAHPVLKAGRTGPEERISEARIAELPNQGRDFLALTTLSPQTVISPSAPAARTGGLTIGGQHRFYNSFRIDGGVNHDLYSGRLPGRETLPRPLSLEAVREIQVLAAPFDVRHAAFAGGLVNAVTKSGTNTLHGSLFGLVSDDALVGDGGATGRPVGEFRTWHYGGTIGGPIVRDRLHFFASVDVQRENVPDPGPLITDTVGGADLAQIGISHADAVRFQSILRDSLRLDPGTLGPVDGRVRARDFFGKVTAQLGTNSRLEVSHHYTHGDRRGFLTRAPGHYHLSTRSQSNPSTVHASRIIWTGLLGRRWSTQLTASRLRLHDRCRPEAGFGVVQVGPVNERLWAGAGGACPVQPIHTVVQDVLQLAEHLTGAFGEHVITFGFDGQRLRFRDDWLGTSGGRWRFGSLDDLAARRPSRLDIGIPGPRWDGGLDFRVWQLGLYVQDRWAPQRRLTLTLGLRADMPTFPDRVATNDALESSLDIDAGTLPGRRVMWSPRLGLNYAAGRAGRTFLRGGIGLFSGPPPFQWIGNAYRDDGTRELYLICRGAKAPTYDPAVLPDTCADGTGPAPRLSAFDPAVRFPQNLKLALGVDHELPGGVVGTLDVLYTRAIHQLYATDANLTTPVGLARGEGDRPLYGSMPSPDGSLGPTPARRDPTLGQVVHIKNASGDHAISVSAQARRRLGSHGEVTAFYSFVRARDRMSMVNRAARNLLNNTPLDGTLDSRPLRTSYFEIPHRVQVSLTTRLPRGIRLSLLYAGSSGTPYTYVVDGDANADGMLPPFWNDAVYVPRDSLDIALVDPGEWEALAGLIQEEPCLRGQRGRVLRRNSCRNPWFGTVSARVTKAFPVVGGRSLEVTADVYNVLNLLNGTWGRQRATIGAGPWVAMLEQKGFDPTAERGIYRTSLAEVRQVQDFASRWRVESSIRYVF